MIYVAVLSLEACVGRYTTSTSHHLVNVRLTKMTSKDIANNQTAIGNAGFVFDLTLYMTLQRQQEAHNCRSLSL